MVLSGLTAPPFRLPLPALLELQLPGSEQPLTPAYDNHHSPAPAVATTPIGAECDLAQDAAALPPQLQPQPLRRAPAKHAGTASFWTAAARGCVQGFGCSGSSSLGASTSLQESQALALQPTEAGYKEWGAAFTKHLHGLRFWSALSTVPSAIRSLIFGDPVKRACAVANVLPLIVFYQNPKVMHTYLLTEMLL